MCLRGLPTPRFPGTYQVAQLLPPSIQLYLPRSDRRGFIRPSVAQATLLGIDASQEGFHLLDSLREGRLCPTLISNFQQRFE